MPQTGLTQRIQSTKAKLRMFGTGLDQPAKFGKFSNAQRCSAEFKSEYPFPSVGSNLILLYFAVNNSKSLVAIYNIFGFKLATKPDCYCRHIKTLNEEFSSVLYSIHCGAVTEHDVCVNSYPHTQHLKLMITNLPETNVNCLFIGFAV